MKILSIDGSTKSSGWSVFEDGKLIDYGCITSSSTDMIKRIQSDQQRVGNNSITNNQKKLIRQFLHQTISAPTKIWIHR